MNIVILDSYTADPDKLSWNEFNQLGGCAIYDRTPEAQVVARLHAAEVVLTNKFNLSRVGHLQNVISQ